MSWVCELQEVVKATKAKILSQLSAEGQMSFSGVGTDSRNELQGKLFIALKGEQFDGHDFVIKAVTNGAAAILVHEWRDEWNPFLDKATFLKVDDTLIGLQELARYWRRKHEFQVVGISGSAGKTSAKEFSYTVISQFFPTHASQGSFNNHWGVPLSILQAEPKHKVLILEMGMNHSGELTTLTRIAEPDIVAVTMVGTAHIGELGSQAKVAEAKEEMYIFCPKAQQIFNLDNTWTYEMWDRAKRRRSAERILTFSTQDSSADVSLHVQSMNWQGLSIKGAIEGVVGETRIRVLGRHNLTNLMVASCVALSVGVRPEQIWSALGQISSIAWGRNQVVSLMIGAKVLFDAYNANPESMAALLDSVFEMEVEGNKFLVLADMLELGQLSEEAHEQLGRQAGRLRCAGILYIGNFREAFARGLKDSGAQTELLSSAQFDEALVKKFSSSFRNNDLIAMKGSRGMKLERVLKSWHPIDFSDKS